MRESVAEFLVFLPFQIIVRQNLPCTFHCALGKLPRLLVLGLRGQALGQMEKRVEREGIFGAEDALLQLKNRPVRCLRLR